MVILRPTQKLLRHLALTPVEPDEPSTTALGDWYALPLFIGRARLVLLTSDKSLFSVVLPLKEARTLVQRWRTTLDARLEAIGVSDRTRKRELAEMGEVRIAKTASRRTLGAMNDLVFQCRVRAAHSGAVDIGELHHVLDELPCGTLDYANPSDAALALLDDGGAAPGRRAGLAIGRAAPRRAVGSTDVGDSTAEPRRRSYILRVALARDPSIWRRIRTSDAHTLAQLHRLIFRAFSRVEEHLYSFYVPPKGAKGRRRLREAKEYTHPFNLEDAPFEKGWAGNAQKTRLRDLALSEGQTFDYLFDFGDAWWHAITVERIEPEEKEALRPVVIERHGESPPQYE